MIQKLLTTILFTVLGVVVVRAQVPQAVCYQGVATDPAGRELINQNIKVRISILKGGLQVLPNGLKIILLRRMVLAYSI